MRPPRFFSFFRGDSGGVGFPSSQWVPQLVPNNCSRYPITSALILYSCKLYEPAQRRRLMQRCLFWDCPKIDWLIFWIIFLWWTNQRYPPQKKEDWKSSVPHGPQLINIIWVSPWLLPVCLCKAFSMCIPVSVSYWGTFTSFSFFSFFLIIFIIIIKKFRWDRAATLQLMFETK